MKRRPDGRWLVRSAMAMLVGAWFVPAHGELLCQTAMAMLVVWALAGE